MLPMDVLAVMQHSIHSTNAHAQDKIYNLNYFIRLAKIQKFVQSVGEALGERT